MGGMAIIVPGSSGSRSPLQGAPAPPPVGRGAGRSGAAPPTVIGAPPVQGRGGPVREDRPAPAPLERGGAPSGRAPAVQAGPGPAGAGPIRDLAGLRAGLMAGMLRRITGLADPDGPHMPDDVRQEAAMALLETMPLIDGSPTDVFGGWQGLVCLVPWLHDALPAPTAERLDGLASRLRARGGPTARLAGRYRDVDVPGGDPLPWMPLTAGTALLAYDMLTYGGRHGDARARLRRSMAGGGVPPTDLDGSAALTATGGLRSDSSALWTLYRPEPGDVAPAMVTAGVRAPLGARAYRRLMERHMRAVEEGQPDQGTVETLVQVRSALWKVWCDPREVLRDSPWTVADLLDVDGPAPRILTDTARYMFGLAKSMLVDGLDAATALSVLQGPSDEGLSAQ